MPDNHLDREIFQLRKAIDQLKAGKYHAFLSASGVFALAAGGLFSYAMNLDARLDRLAQDLGTRVAILEKAESNRIANVHQSKMDHIVVHRREREQFESLTAFLRKELGFTVSGKRIEK